MKKIFFTPFITLALVAGVHAQTLKESKVPAAVKSGFKKAHPSANAAWEKEEGNFEATFKEGGKDISCVLNHEGTILETETEMASSQLPASVLNYLHLHHKGQKIQEASKIVKATGEVNYEARVNGKDLLFGADGHYIKENKEAND